MTYYILYRKRRGLGNNKRTNEFRIPVEYTGIHRHGCIHLYTVHTKALPVAGFLEIESGVSPNVVIVVGAMMDIYSAIVVIVPLIAPIAAAYGIDPIHLAIVFLANMELGYLMPPMGENLFLSSYRFDKPLTEVYRSTLPYTVLLLLTVLLITYFPPMSLWLVNVVFQGGP